MKIKPTRIFTFAYFFPKVVGTNKGISLSFDLLPHNKKHHKFFFKCIGQAKLILTLMSIAK